MVVNLGYLLSFENYFRIKSRNLMNKLENSNLFSNFTIKIEGIFIRNIKNTWWVSQNKRSNAY